MSIFGKSKGEWTCSLGLALSLGAAIVFSATQSNAVEIITSATLNCKFVTECVETDACQDADFNVAIEGTMPVEGKGFTAQKINSAIFSLDAQGEADLSSTIVNAQDGDTSHLIVVASDGVAKYINLMVSVPMVITYHGTCAMETSE